MAPARSMAASLRTASALVVVVALAALWCDPVAGGSGIVKATKPRHKPSKEKFAELHFYFHDNVQAPNARIPVATSFFVVPPLDGIPPTPVGFTAFGGVVVFDNKLTAGPSQSSLEVGRGRGIYAWDSLDAANAGLELIFTAVFNEASGFPNSTIQFRGFNSVPAPVREISIAGGTGEFRLARGWADYTPFGFDGAFSASLNITANVYYGGSGRYDE